MKLSTLTTKLTCLKSNAVRVLATVSLAGAAFLAAPAAQAQHVSFGVVIGAPAYVAPAPAYYGPRNGFYAEGRYWADRRAYDDFNRRNFDQRESWEHRDAYRDRDHDGDRFRSYNRR